YVPDGRQRAVAAAQLRGGEDGLQAADPAAGAAHARRVDDDVTDLARGEGVPVDQRPADHKAGADASLDSEQHQVGRGGAAEGVLGQDGGVGVVGDVNREVEAAAKDAGQVDPGPVQVVGVEDHAVPVDHAGRADAHAEHRPVDGGTQPLGQADGDADRFLAAGAVQRDLRPRLDLPGQVNHGARHPVGGREVEGD